MSILVVCDDPSHHGRTVKVCSFTHVGGIGWTVAPATRHNGETAEHGSAWRDGELAPRFRLECRLCGLSIVARHGTMSVILDTLANVGFNRIDLRLLAARLTSANR